MYKFLPTKRVFLMFCGTILAIDAVGESKIILTSTTTSSTFRLTFFFNLNGIYKSIYFCIRKGQSHENFALLDHIFSLCSYCRSLFFTNFFLYFLFLELTILQCLLQETASMRFCNLSDFLRSTDTN